MLRPLTAPRPLTDPLLALLLILAAQSARAASPALEPGDVLLQPLQCWSCTLIEEEESTIYSHVGMVISTSPEVLVAEALGSVRTLPLQTFQQRTEPGQKIRVLRLRNETLKQQLRAQQTRLLALYLSEYDGLPYDHDFLWENHSPTGEEPLYCSEFVAKIYERTLGLVIPLKRMHFDRNPELWRRYFKGNPPAGEWGLSPGDLERSEVFQNMGELN